MYVCMYRVFIASFVYGQMLVRKIVVQFFINGTLLICFLGLATNNGPSILT